MTPDERLEEYLLAQRHLGRLFPLWGVVPGPDGELRCECSKAVCPKPGKHPRRGGWQKHASDDPDTLIGWCQKFPLANFGVVTGEKAFAIDVDVRPEKSGQAVIEWLEIDNGIRVPYTATVMTGRNNGSHHRYFQLPSIPIKNKVDFMRGLDVRTKGGFCVAPGSRHVSGGFYRFAEELRPDEEGLAVLPDFLLELLPQKTPTNAIAGPQMPTSALIDLSGREGPDKPLMDSVVLGIMNRDPVARFYLEGGRNPHQSPSEDDFALACKLAFYCRHNLHQMYRLFMRSGLFRPKFLEKRPGYANYAVRTLEYAIRHTPDRWIRKKRVRPSRATGAKKGRKISPATIAVLDLHSRHPKLQPKEIAAALGTKPSKVRDILHYHRAKITSQVASENAGTLIHVFPSREVEPEPFVSKVFLPHGNVERVSVGHQTQDGFIFKLTNPESLSPTEPAAYG